MKFMLTDTHLYAMISLFSAFLGALGFIFACAALIKVMAMERSTHSVQYMPVDPEIEKANKEFLDEWATSEETLKEQNKLFKEDLEDEMPELSPEDDDRKKYIF